MKKTNLPNVFIISMFPSVSLNHERVIMKWLIYSEKK